MALTLEAEQRMESVGLAKFLSDDQDAWLATAKETKKFVTANFPAGAKIRRDDVAKALIPILEVHEGFRDFLDENKLRGKYWIKDFADLIIDKTWDALSKEGTNGQK